jgi:hypothetical protein
MSAPKLHLARDPSRTQCGRMARHLRIVSADDRFYVSPDGPGYAQMCRTCLAKAGAR